jgi:high-affinity iron transporter
VLPGFIIFLREGIEASMIVAILLAYLNRLGKRENFRDVYLGVAAAMVLVIVGGVGAYALVRQYEGSNIQTYFETGTYLLAAFFLTYMTFWMHLHARTMGKELERRSDEALSKGSRWGLAALSFQAVGREGLETMVFTLAIIFTNSRQAATPVSGGSVLIGAVIGLACALGLAFAMYKLGTRVNLKIFFRSLGILLMLFAAGLLADAIENVQQLGWIKFGAHPLWNSGSVMSESSSLGDVFHSLVGYAQQPTVLQGAVWAFYVLISVGVFVRLGKKPVARV